MPESPEERVARLVRQAHRARESVDAQRKVIAGDAVAQQHSVLELLNAAAEYVLSNPRTPYKRVRSRGPNVGLVKKRGISRILPTTYEASLIADPGFIDVAWVAFPVFQGWDSSLKHQSVVVGRDRGLYAVSACSDVIDLDVVRGRAGRNGHLYPSSDRFDMKKLREWATESAEYRRILRRCENAIGAQGFRWGDLQTGVAWPLTVEPGGVLVEHQQMWMADRGFLGRPSPMTPSVKDLEGGIATALAAADRGEFPWAAGNEPTWVF